MPNEKKKRFVDQLMPAALEVAAQTGIDPRIIVAQAAIETGWGKSAPGNNYFGIKSHGKGGGQTFTTHEVINGKRVKIKDSFRQYASPTESVRGYGEFVTRNPRYRPLREARGLDAQLAALQASGYATDPAYSSKVGRIARNLPSMSGASSRPAQTRDPVQGSVTPFAPQPSQPNASQPTNALQLRPSLPANASPPSPANALAPQMSNVAPPRPGPVVAWAPSTFLNNALRY